MAYHYLAQSGEDLARLPPADQRWAKAAIDALGGGPDQGDTRKLQGGRDAWRLRVGDWRVRFMPDFANKAILIQRILPRGRAYRD